MINPNSVFNVKLMKQGGSDSEVIICFSTKFEVKVIKGLGGAAAV